MSNQELGSANEKLLNKYPTLHRDSVLELSRIVAEIARYANFNQVEGTEIIFRHLMLAYISLQGNDVETFGKWLVAAHDGLHYAAAALKQELDEQDTIAGPGECSEGGRPIAQFSHRCVECQRLIDHAIQQDVNFAVESLGAVVDDGSGYDDDPWYAEMNTDMEQTAKENAKPILRIVK